MIVDTVVVALLAVLVLGLLRSHADILRALHRLDAGVGDPAVPGSDRPSNGPPPGMGNGTATRVDGQGAAPTGPAPLLMGPPLPGERNSSSAPDIAGVTPEGDAKALRVTGVPHRTLLCFLSSGCATCAGIWEELDDPVAAGVPEDVRVVAVTKGPELEISGEVVRRAPGGVTVVMSTEAWGDYEVPGSPFFVLVDGPGGRRAGEGVANRLHQVAELVRRATVDGQPPAAARTLGRATAVGLDGPAREAQNDAELGAAGILPGDPSLYPQAMEDLFAPSPEAARAPSHGGGTPPSAH